MPTETKPVEPLFIRRYYTSDLRRGRHFRKPRACEACGVEGVVHRAPLICDDCLVLLREAYKARKAATVKAYRAWSYVDTRDYNVPHSRTVSKISEALRYLVRRESHFRVRELKIEVGGDIGRKKDKRPEPSSSNEELWLLTPEQAKFLDEALQGLKTLVSDVYADGFERGRLLLQGIADGSLSTEDVNEWCRRYGKREEKP